MGVQRRCWEIGNRVKSVETGATAFPRALGSTWALGPQKLVRPLQVETLWGSFAGKPWLSGRDCLFILQPQSMAAVLLWDSPLSTSRPEVRTHVTTLLHWWSLRLGLPWPSLPLYNLSSYVRFAFGFKYGVWNFYTKVKTFYWIKLMLVFSVASWNLRCRLIYPAIPSPRGQGTFNFCCGQLMVRIVNWKIISTRCFIPKRFYSGKRKGCSPEHTDIASHRHTIACVSR